MNRKLFQSNAHSNNSKYYALHHILNYCYVYVLLWNNFAVQHNTFCLPCVTTLHNVVQFIWVPNPRCHGTEWAGVLLNLFVPPKMKRADGSGPGNVDSTHRAHANSAPTACGSHMSVSYSSQQSVTTVTVIITVISPFLVQHWLSPNSAYEMLCVHVCQHLQVPL